MNLIPNFAAPPPERPYWKCSTSRETSSRAVILANREERGLINYEKSAMHELRQFAAQRHITIPRKTRKKQAVIKILEAADEESIFDKLFDLPPEIRLLIFDFYLAPFTFSGGTMVPPPPLAQASSQLRNEALPLFGLRHSHVILIALSSGEGLASNNPDDYDICPRDKAFLDHASDERLASIKNIFFIVRIQESPRYWYRWNCRLLGSGRRYEVTPDHVLTHDSAPRRETLIEETQKRLSALLSVIARRPSGAGLIREDITSLLEVWKGAVSTDAARSQ